MTRLPTLTERRKRISIESELQKGKLLVHLDPRKEGVRVPEELMNQPVLGLNFSRHFPFANTEVGPVALSASLSFGGVRYDCVVPYDAIFCVTQTASREQTWFSESLPDELQSWLNSGESTQAEEMEPRDAESIPFADRLDDADGSQKKSPILKLVE